MSSAHLTFFMNIKELPPLKKKRELFVRDKSALNFELFCEDLATNLS